MIDRRSVLGLAVGAVALSASRVRAADWKSAYPELVFALIPAENATGVTERYAPLMDYLAKELGVKVTLRIAQDYAAVIEGQRAGQIHIGYYGPSSFARALMTGVKIEPIAIEVNADGTKGYYSVLYVKKDSPYQKVEDLKGKNLGLVDPNSTSGFNVPRYSLDKMGINPEEFFAKVVNTGSHENAIIALQQGTVDVAANWWNDENESNLMRMERKGMAKYADFRIVFKSEQIVNSPYAVLSDMPADAREAIRTAFLAFPSKEPAAFEKMFAGQQKPWQPVDVDAYQPVIALNKFVDTLRKKKS